MQDQKRSLQWYLILLPALVFVFIGIYHFRTDFFSSSFTTVSDNQLSSEVDTFHFLSPIARLLAQLIVILIASRLSGYLFSKIGQPTVIGEIIAGIILGPSLLGRVWPDGLQMLFPKESTVLLGNISQLGLILFMFVIGMELDFKVFKSKARAALLLSHGTIAIAFVMALLLSFWLYPKFGNPSKGPLAFCLFLGVSFAVTAFPVLARIVFEKNLQKKAVGVLALACAAIDDVTAWCLLAGIIAFAEAGSSIHLLTIGGLSAVFIFLALGVIQPLFKRLGEIYVTEENTSKPVVAFVFFTLFLFAYITEILGIHPLFGAFLSGLIMPNKVGFKRVLTEKIEDLSLVVLLPLFFAYTGLRTDFSSLNHNGGFQYAAVIIAVAMLSKIGGGSLLGRLSGLNWKDSFVLGALLNTRGLMELIVLNIGFDLGILSAELFTILVLMALFTTFLTGPLLYLIEFVSPSKEKATTSTDPKLSVLIAFGQSKMGANLLLLASRFIGQSYAKVKFKAAHYTPYADVLRMDAVKFEKEAFASIRQTAVEKGIRLDTVYKGTDDVNAEILSTIREDNIQLLLIGGAKSIFSDNYTGGRVKTLVHDSPCSVGILVEKSPKLEFNNICLLLENYKDTKLLELALQLKKSSQGKLSVVDLSGVVPMLQESSTEDPIINALKSGEFTLLGNYKEPNRELFEQFDFLIAELRYWERLIKSKSDCLNYVPSLFIIKMNPDLTERLEDNNLIKQMLSPDTSL